MTTFQWQELPQNLDALKQLPEAGLKTPEETAALTVAALCVYGKDAAACLEMLAYLKGPAVLTPYEKQFLKDRLSGKEYVPFSYLGGALPANGYQPAVPYTVNVERLPDTEAGYAKVALHSSGADAPRPVRLRKKESTGQWFLDEQFLLADIRIPDSRDPWK